MTLFLTAVVRHNLSYQIIITSNNSNPQYMLERIITKVVVVGYFQMVSVGTTQAMIVLSDKNK